MSKCCDNCIYYRWYYDHCDKWNCDVEEALAEFAKVEKDMRKIARMIGKELDERV